MYPSLELQPLVNKLLSIREAILEVDEVCESHLDRTHSNYQYNTLNFLRYLKLRTFDLRDIQGSLSALGVSSLSHAERQVLANIENILYLLTAHLGQPFAGKHEFGEHPVNFIESAKKLRENTQRLFGDHITKMGIMVTLPPEATDPAHLKQLLEAGMNIARINCSHDDVNVWKQMVVNLRTLCDEMKLSCSVYADLAGPKIRTKEILPPRSLEHKKQGAIVWEGDEIYLVKSLKSKRAKRSIDQNAVTFTCTLPSIIDDSGEGDPIWFDDGKVGGVIKKKYKGGLKIKVTRTDPKGGKLKPEKGINLPNTRLNLPSLTTEDIQNLDFICEYADVVGFSFVRTPEDVATLQHELKKREKNDLGIVLKIENKQAFKNLPVLILKAMENPTIGIMTARGDLAVELGAERLSEVQEQIMWLCEAAMVPNIWATQVLESLAKNGIASRAEITDAAMSVRAECVMLNKGPHIVLALKTLGNILGRMEQHLFKKQGTLRKLKVATSFWNHLEPSLEE